MSRTGYSVFCRRGRTSPHLQISLTGTIHTRRGVKLHMWKLYEFASALMARTQREDGQTMVEYAFLVAFIALVVLVAVKLLGTSISSLFNSIATSL
jgi:pilus assembly protein Flp/PilA